MSASRLSLSGFLILAFYWMSASNAVALSEEALQRAQLSRVEILEILNGGNWREIDKVTGQIARHHLQDEQIKSALISVLQQETEFQRASGAGVGEGRGEYYINLLDVVSQIKDDTGIIDVLIESLGVAGGIRVPRALAEFGTASLGPLAERYDHANERARSSIIYTVAAIAGSSNLDSSDQQRVTGLLSTGLKDSSASVRMRAIDGLVTCKYTDAISELNAVAANDGYFHLRDVDGKKVKTYPVRDKARKAVETLSIQK